MAIISIILFEIIMSSSQKDKSVESIRSDDEILE